MKKQQRIVKGVLTDDQSSCLQYGYKIYINDRLVFTRGGRTSFWNTKRELRKTVRRYYKNESITQYEFQLPPKDQL